MPKEWILNSAMNRFQLNFKRNVGAVSEEIRKCNPQTISDWEEYYFNNVRSKSHIEELGRKLYTKITEIIQTEVNEVSVEDCINYMKQLVIDRTYDGYTTEIQTVYGQLQNILNIKIEPAPDKWDRLFNIDFFIKINDKYIGLQIKPVTTQSGIQIPEIFKEKAIQDKTHTKFTKQYGGKVFYIYSTKINGKKEILNKAVIDEIKTEIDRLSK